MDLDSNPNFLVLSSDDYIKASQKLTDRAGVLLAIVGAASTAIIALNAGSSLSIDEALYTFFLPFILTITSFIFYIKAYNKSLTFLPYSYMHKLASEDRLELTDPEKGLHNYKKMYTDAKEVHKNKKGYIHWADGFLYVSIFYFALVNIATFRFIRDELHTNLYVATALLLIIGVLIAYALRTKKRTEKPKMYEGQINIRPSVQLVSIVSTPSQLVIAGQQTAGQETRIDIPIDQIVEALRAQGIKVDVPQPSPQPVISKPQ